ncbi:MAG: M48 family peptidase [Micavibrio aeruginosavorus]|uniref:M48 family peptidase n=1 Tax=Micavibrio aeruginosavorus TaxID=349221 RepID=A0A2W5A502_9BACT|nr:MAG: M48 family peptidase [Micavibrio aeruginosavorus]
MAKRVKPLNAERARARSGRDLFSFSQENEWFGLPFAEISPRLKLSVSERAKRMALRLDPRERLVHLVVPKRASMRTAYLFAEQNKDWIREKLRDLPSAVPFRDGETLPILGRDRKIIVLYNPALKRTDIQLKKDELLVLTNKPDPSQRIRRFLIDLAKEKLTEMSLEKASLIRRRILDVQVKDTRSRWGSCSDDGNLSFSWRLIFAPSKAFDYVVAHECAHLVHMDHSDNFWRVCERLSRDYEEGKDWMQKYGHSLMRFGTISS